MGLDTEIKRYATEEQLAYAEWLDWGMRTGFILLVITFIIYLTGLTTPHVSLEELPKYWGLPADQYIKTTGAPVGWGWLAMIGRGDYMNFLGIGFLSAVTIACYIRILPILKRTGDKVFFAIAVLEVAVLSLAASGLLVVGH